MGCACGAKRIRIIMAIRRINIKTGKNSLFIEIGYAFGVVGNNCIKSY
jgi:hypothetical protein